MDAFNKFLGTERWRALIAAYKSETQKIASPGLKLDSLIVALLISFTPVLLTFWEELRPEGAPPSPLPTLGFGVCTLLALVVRSRLGLPFTKTINWKQSLGLTHTAVALGCIPTVFILILSKTLLAERHDTLAKAVGGASNPGAPIGLLGSISIVLAIAAWVAITEELIFRGTLMSVIRRLKFIKTQKNRDLTAIVASALIFGLAHYMTWGLLPAIALAGLGLGFGTAYIANGEQLVPLILYHFVFDALSIAVSMLS